MHLLGGATDGQTPLDPDEAEGLLRRTITTLGELDEVEQENIAKAIPWALRTARGAADIMTEAFLRDLHHRMYGDVWRWAGTYRRSNRNIGVEWWQVPTEIAALVGDGRYWLESGTLAPAELCVRFTHRLVSHVHPFPNGNGRHSRLVATRSRSAWASRHTPEVSASSSRPASSAAATWMAYVAPTRATSLRCLHSPARKSAPRPLTETEAGAPSRPSLRTRRPAIRRGCNSAQCSTAATSRRHPSTRPRRDRAARAQASRREGPCRPLRARCWRGTAGRRSTATGGRVSRCRHGATRRATPGCVRRARHGATPSMGSSAALRAWGRSSARLLRR